MATCMATFPAASSRAGRSTVRPLTETVIKNLRVGESRTDGALPPGNGRLVLYCLSRGGGTHRVWTFRYRKQDLRGEMTLGEHPALPLERARSRARDLMELVRQGADPQAKAKEDKAVLIATARAQAALGTFESLLDAYVAKLKLAEKASWREVERLFILHVKKPWPGSMKAPANSVTSELVRDMLARLVKKGITRQTNVLRSYLHAAFTYGAHSDLDPRRAAEEAATFRLTGNPVALLPRIQEFETTRDRVLTDEEFAFLWKQLASIRLEIGLAIRCLILLGGQRSRQLLRATWDDYDNKGKLLTLEDAKGKRAKAVPHVLPVSKAVADILGQLRELNGSGAFIFSTTAGLKPIHSTSLPGIFADIRGAWPLVDGQAAPDFQGRDIRRSVETRLQALGVAREVRAQLLSHGRTSGVQQKHYERHQFIEEKAQALALLEGHLMTLFKASAVRGRARR